MTLLLTDYRITTDQHNYILERAVRVKATGELKRDVETGEVVHKQIAFYGSDYARGLGKRLLHIAVHEQNVTTSDAAEFARIINNAVDAVDAFVARELG